MLKIFLTIILFSFNTHSASQGQIDRYSSVELDIDLSIVVLMGISGIDNISFGELPEDNNSNLQLTNY